MDLTLQTLRQYLTKTVLQCSMRADRTLSAAYHAAQETEYKAPFQVRCTDSQGALMGFYEGTVTASLLSTIAGGTVFPYAKATQHNLSIAGTIVNGSIVAIGDDRYEFRTSGSVTAGNITVPLAGTGGSVEAANALVTTANAANTGGYVLSTVSAYGVLVEANTPIGMHREGDNIGTLTSSVEMQGGTAVFSLVFPPGVYASGDMSTLSTADFTNADGRVAAGDVHTATFVA